MIIGFTINKIESARHVPLEELSKYKNINVNYDLNLRNLSVVKSPAVPEKVLRVEYTVTINYLNPSIGYIRFEGYCDHAGGDAEKAFKDWESGKADTGIQNEVANNMMVRITPLAMLLSQNLNLPPAVPVPVINFQKPEAGGAKDDKFDFYHA
ncbi:hypothetical protein CUJ83_11685 [Methanocella sp. CWC-04]|uniref:Preprotein translocase subunit SecB n=2 Tax=Methanooceanicella nereidis TaxID=2052831 RepID=A0AAP2RE79_9EURY|nr:hypothetical protein [Methanocella sp. CWC-04]MCD1295658.1 hypothetical protein [Methanocella sp. CWC-04]